MQDFLYRGVINQLNVRFSYAMTTKLVNTAILKHNCNPVSGHNLGRCLTAGTLLSPLLNDKERLCIQWNYPGLLKTIVIDLGNKGDVRGFCRFDKEIMEKANNEKAIYGDKGLVNVIKSDATKVIQNSSTEAYLHNPVDDLSFYFSISEQIETEIQSVIGFNNDPNNPVHTSQGFMIQALPDCNLNDFAKLRKKMSDENFYTLLRQEPSNDNYFENLVNILIENMDGVDYSLNNCPVPLFKCYCSLQKTILAAKTLPKDVLLDHKQKNIPLNLSCDFCSSKYNIPQKIIDHLIDEKEK